MGGYGSGRRSQSMFKEMTEDMLALDIRVLKRQGSLAKSSRVSFAIKSGVAKIAVGDGGSTPAGAREYEGRTNWHSDLTEEAGRLLCQSEGSSVNLVFPTYVDAAHQTRALPKQRHYSSAGGYRVVDQQVQLTATPCSLGGHRLWWRCPCCEGRVAILYLRLTHGPEEGGTEPKTRSHWWGRGFFACRKCLDLVYASQYQSAGDRCQYRANDIRIQLGATFSQINAGVRLFDKPKGMHYKKFFRLLHELWWRDEVFMIQILQQFARYEMLIEMERLAQEKKQQALIERQAKIATRRPHKQPASRRSSKRANTKKQSIKVKAAGNRPLYPTAKGISKAKGVEVVAVKEVTTLNASPGRTRRRPDRMITQYWTKYAPLLAADAANRGIANRGIKNPSVKNQEKKTQEKSHLAPVSLHGKPGRSRDKSRKRLASSKRRQSTSVAMPTIRIAFFKARAQNFKSQRYWRKITSF